MTIVDVAQAAEVSLKTVSRVINREPHVRPAVVAKVEAAITALGFVPNPAARSLAGARSFMIGAFFDNPSPYYLVRLQAGAMEACRAAGYHLVIEQLAPADTLHAETFRQTLRTLRLDGAILSPPVSDYTLVMQCLEERHIPFVRLSPLSEPERSPAIYSNDADGAAQAARHLHDLGHRSFGFVAGPPHHLASALRREGFLSELARYGIARSDVREVQGDFSFASGLSAGTSLLTDQLHVTAIFAANDDMAAGVLAAAARLNIVIPDEVSLVGFDDSPAATLVWPSITTIRQPIAEMSAAAVRMLIGRETEESRPPAFNVTLVDRKSTGFNRTLVRRALSSG